jgi:hypothetical protein
VTCHEGTELEKARFTQDVRMDVLIASWKMKVIATFTKDDVSSSAVRCQSCSSSLFVNNLHGY